MKKTTKAMIAGLMSGVMFGVHAFAVELTLSELNVTPEGEITIAGLGNPGPVYVEIIKDFSSGSLVGDRVPVVIDLVQTDENGRFSRSWKLPQNAEMGDYSVILNDTAVHSDGGMVVQGMFYAGTEDVKKALEQINGHMNSLLSLMDDLKNDTVIKPLQLSILVDDFIYRQYTDQVLQSVQAQSPADGFPSSEALISALSGAMGVVMLNNSGSSDFDEAV